jgi:3-deoxy-D-manno-octulosonic-acid transferase
MRNFLKNCLHRNLKEMIKPNSKILIIHLSAIGDVILTLPAAHALRASFPQAYIAWVVEDAGYHLLQGHPELDEVILFPKKELQETLKENGFLAAMKLILEFRRKLRSYHFDLVIDFHGMLKSGIIALFTGAKIRAGFGPGREGNRFFLTKVFDPPTTSLHFADWELELSHRLGADTDDVQFVFPDYQKEEKVIENFLVANLIKSPFFCIAPGTSWLTKCWTSEGMAKLMDRLSAYGSVLIIGSELDRDIIEATKKLLITKPIDATGMFNLRELAVLLGRAALFFGGDTGPMHLAVARGTKTIAWMGPTKSSRTGPYPGKGITVSLGLPCQFCHKKKCPENHHNCLKNLPFEMVWAAAEPYVKQLKAGDH